MSFGRVVLNTLAGLALSLLVVIPVVLFLGGSRAFLEGSGLGWVFTAVSFGVVGYLVFQRLRRK